MHRNQVEVPKLTDEQYRDAITVIPADYWSLNCWTCKTDGHTTFTCPSLTPAQRLYFAYCYFVYQCKGHPTMRLATSETRKTCSQDSRTSWLKCPSPAKPRSTFPSEAQILWYRPSSPAVPEPPQARDYQERTRQQDPNAHRDPSWRGPSSTHWCQGSGIRYKRLGKRAGTRVEQSRPLSPSMLGCSENKVNMLDRPYETVSVLSRKDSVLDAPLKTKPYLNAPPDPPLSSATHQDSGAEHESSPTCQLQVSSYQS